MKILMTGPDNDASKTLGGIVTVVNMILKNATESIDYFSRALDGKNKIISLVEKILNFRRKMRSHAYDWVHIHVAFEKRSIARDALFAYYASKCNIPLIIHFHGGSALFKRDNSLIIKWFVSKAKKIIVLSEIEKESIKQLYKVDVNKVNVLHNCIDIFEIPSTLITKPIGDNIIFFGRIHESKGIDDIVEALKILKEKEVSFQFDVYGSGPRKEMFLSSLETILGDSFHYGGLVWGNNKWQMLNDSDIFLLPSRYGEGLPMALLEAMALGKVVIVTDDASITKVVKNNENGLVIAKRNPTILAETLERILENKQKMVILGENAKNTIEKNYAVGSYIDNLNKIYHNN